MKIIPWPLLVKLRDKYVRVAVQISYRVRKLKSNLLREMRSSDQARISDGELKQLSP